MKVTMISPYGNKWIGGISSFVSSLSEALRRIGVPCELVVNRGGDAATVELRGPKLLFSIRSFAFLLRSRPSVVHAHSHWYALLPGVAYRLLKPDSFLVFSQHTPTSRPTRLGRWSLEGLMARCDVVTAVSEEIAASFRVPPRVAIEIISPGSQGRLLDYESSRISLTLPNRCFVVTFVGPLAWREKAAGVQVLVQAFSSFNSNHPESVLFVVGGGPFLAEIQRTVFELKAQDNVRVVGQVADPRPYLGACDVYAQISFKEGMPLSLLDAMGAGKAIIASNVGGVPRLVEHMKCGLLVGNEVVEVASALECLHRNSALRKQLGEAARKRVLAEFTWDSAAAHFRDLYRRTINGKTVA